MDLPLDLAHLRHEVRNFELDAMELPTLAETPIAKDLEFRFACGVSFRSVVRKARFADETN